MHNQDKHAGSPVVHWNVVSDEAPFADIGHKMLTLWALAIMLAIQAGALDLPTTPSQLGAPPCKTAAGLPIHFPISVPDPQVPRISSIRKGHLRDVQLAPQEPDVHPYKYLVSSSKLSDCK